MASTNKNLQVKKGDATMYTCEFCNTEFLPRPQVKNPRACNKDVCQRRRQASNEKEWRKRHIHLASKNYHQIRRKQRLEKIKKLIKSIVRSFSIGIDFLGLPVDIKSFTTILEHLFYSLGLRKINKFWSVDLLYNFEQLDLCLK